MHSGSKKANRLFGYDMGPASDVQTPIVDPIVRKSTKLFFSKLSGSRIEFPHLRVFPANIRLLFPC